MSAEVDAEVTKIIDGAYKKAEQSLIDNKKLLDAIAGELMKVETLERNDFEKILILHGIEPKKLEEEVV